MFLSVQKRPALCLAQMAPVHNIQHTPQLLTDISYRRPVHLVECRDSVIWDQVTLLS